MRQNYNKKNKCLALLGQGKWKHALGCTLLLIGFVLGLGGMKAYAQSYEDGKLIMSKKFYPSNDEHTQGDLWLETYVTGAQFTTSIAVPADIVLVLDMSYSMRSNNMGNVTRVQALHNAVQDFLEVVGNKDVPNAGAEGTIGHRVSIVAFSSQERSALYSTTSEVQYNNVTDALCRQSLREIHSAPNVLNTALTNTAVGRITANNCVIGTYAQYGLELAERVFSTREVTTFAGPDGPQPRSTIVVFFTDGYPGGSGTQGDFYYPRNSGNTSYNQAYEADAAVYRANILKNPNGSNAVVYTVGIFDAANPRADYIAGYTSSSNNNYYGYYRQGTSAANGMMHMISTDLAYQSDIQAPNYNNPANGSGSQNYNPGYFHRHIGDNNNHGSNFFYVDSEGKEHISKYFAATDQAGLSQVFSTIAASAGSDPISMTAGTMVQDVISPTFTLQGGTNVDAIEVYAVKCTYAEVDASGNVTNCEFNTVGGDDLGYGTKTSYSNGQIQYLTLINNPGGDNHGAVDETTAEGKENRLRSGDIVEIVEEQGTGNQQVNITGFNFKAMYCGEVVLNGVTTYVGRKLVIKIPIQVKEGIWGDDFNTNGEMSLVQPDGSTTTYQFERPITNVMGAVWTEKVNTKPANFPVITSETQTIEIGTPEELAWFVSEVNGRIHYQDNNTVASHPKLNAILTADIDMSAHNWVPIGAGYKCNDHDEYVDSNGNTVYQYDDQGHIMYDDENKPITVPTVKLAYEGTFDGNGHIITGLKNNAAKFYKLAHGEQYIVVVFPGMFSNVKGTVKNVHVLDSDFRARNHDRERETFVHFGIIADTLSGGSIFNCEAVGRITCDVDTDPTTGVIIPEQLARDSEIVLGGLVGHNNGGTIHSCMAMPTLTGYTMGGMIGLNEGSFTNGFTNPVFNYLDNNIVMPVGGIAGVNATDSNIKNCYVRFSRQSSKLDKATFGQVVGDGTFTQTSCYTPRNNNQENSLIGGNNAWNGTIPNVGASSSLYSIRRNPSHMRGDRSNDNMVGGTWIEQEDMYVLSGGTPMLTKLMAGVASGQASWKRTTAGGFSTSPNGGNINGDYPVLVFNSFLDAEGESKAVTCLASNNNGIGIDYAISLDEMLDRHNNYTLNKTSTWNSNVYKDTPVAVLKGGAINLFKNETTGLGTSSEAGTMLYIDENVSLLQTSNAAIDAYTGQTIIDYGSTYAPQSGNRWHNVSSSLDHSVFGLSYVITDQVPSALGDDWEDFVEEYKANNENYSLVPEDPCRVWAASDNDDAAVFPGDMSSFHPFDFYCFYEPQYHWLNFKRNKDSHWHMDDPMVQIEYPNQETEFVPGKGYLLALHTEYFANWHKWNGDGKDRQFLQNRGTLNNGPVEIDVTAEAPAWTGLKGYNLLGNPYQSYLDFDAFANADENEYLWKGSNYSKTFAVFDPSDVTTTGPKGGSYVQYMANSSKGAKVAGPTINMHQGFFIQVAIDTTATFTNAMRTNDAEPNFRGPRPAYPLINFTLTDNAGQTDIAVLELNRPENDGAKKLRLGDPAGRIYFNYDDEHLAIYFRNSDKDYQSLCFAAEEDGNFTLSWNTANANFSSLQLIDNITGVKTDMLTHDHYTFQGRVSDYATRFKIVFGAFTDVEEQEETLTETFAFINGDNLIVNGTGHFDVIDVLGRVIYATELTDTQNTVSLPANFKGVGMLRISNGNEVKVQKIIIK